MSATTAAALILAVMVAAFVAAKLLKVSTELALFAAALAGALAGGQGLPARAIVEGAFTYFDIVLIFVTATLFMNLLKESGAVAFVVRAILRRFHRRKAWLFILLALLLLVPGALTGAGSVTVLIMGGMAATVLGTMDIPAPKVAAIIFVIAGLSAAAPPVNLWAMLTAAGVNMPYVGFFLPLLVPCVLLALVTIFILGAGAKPVDLAKALAELPEAPARMNWARVGTPFLIFFALVVAGRALPFSLPVLGLPLMFAAAAAAAVLLSPVRIDVLRTSRETVHQLLPLIGMLTCAGILVEIMALTGVRGLIAITVVTLPVFVVILTLALTLPVSEAVLMWGAAPVLGVPLVLLFNTIGLNPVVALAGMSVLWPLGDAIPPTAIIGRLTTATIGMKEPYGRFLRYCLVPGLIIAVVGTLMVVFSKKLAFLTVF
ncbi:MAG TPA: C4-dicarboxylate ABC transporter [Candidatus Aminicenantes bacterium]|nr:C4-dicarboxylate ABC transporter [Candidatus Aminicenantes bacterium]HRY64625.1 C4-dicarboxylate ABC transporter [Candidatus Aminicenantes bacterium]HRZ71538.1 C4-dicarboxylate ABC transporter [Candidatus Aminicenantes bacterium]